MKRIKHLITALVILLVVKSPYVLPVISNPIIVQAASVKISEKKITLQVGESKTLHITGTSKKISWKSSDKSVATVSSKGKVTAVKAGAAKITATLNNKKYTCTVTVNDTNPYLDKADFEAVEVNVGDISLVVPKDLSFRINSMEEGYGCNALLDTGLEGSYIEINTFRQEWPARDYKELKQEMLDSRSLDSIYQNEYVLWGHEDVQLSDYKQSDHSSPNGMVCVIEYMLNHSQKISEYFLETDHYSISILVLDADDMDLASIADFIIDSVMVKPQ